MARKKNKIDIRYLLIEAVLIVFTVSLALALNEWRSNIKESKIKENALQNIIREVKANKIDLERKLAYHRGTSQKISKYLNNDSLWATLKYNSGVEAVGQLMSKGIYEPNLQSGAWNSAVLSGVVNSFDYNTLYTLSNLYQLQKEGPESTWKIMARFFSEPTSYNKENARQLAMMFQLAFGELYNQEKSLLQSYDSVLETLDN